METKRNFRGLVVGLGMLLAACSFPAFGQLQKKAKGDDFFIKLKRKFPKESDRGENSIFRKVKSENEKIAEAEPLFKKIAEAEPLFKKKKKEQKKEITEPAGTEEAEEKEKEVAEVEEPAKKKEKKPAEKEKPAKSPDSKPKLIASVTETRPGPSAPKKSPGSSKARTVGKDGIIQYETWEDVPVKQRPTVDRMLELLVKKPVSRPLAGALPPLPLPPPRVVPAPKKSEPAPKAEENPAAEPEAENAEKKKEAEAETETAAEEEGKKAAESPREEGEKKTPIRARVIEEPDTEPTGPVRISD